MPSVARGGFALVALLALSGIAAAAECPSAADEIATDRPDVTNSSLVVPAGSVQAENGVNLTFRSRATTIDATNTRLRLGIVSCLEVLLDLPDYVHPLHGRLPAGFSDLAPAIKTQLGPLPGAIDLAATAGLGLPTGAVAISGPGPEPYLQFPWSRELGAGWEIEGMATEFWFPSARAARMLTEWTTAIGREVAPGADLFLEYVGDFPAHRAPSHVINTGGVYRVTRTQQLDLHLGFGVDRRAPTSFFGVGYSLRWDGLW